MPLLAPLRVATWYGEVQLICLLCTSYLGPLPPEMAPNSSDSDHFGQAPAVQQAFPKCPSFPCAGTSPV